MLTDSSWTPAGAMEEDASTIGAELQAGLERRNVPTGGFGFGYAIEQECTHADAALGEAFDWIEKRELMLILEPGSDPIDLFFGRSNHT